MKKSSILVLAAFSTLAMSVHGQTASPSAAVTAKPTTVEDKQVEDLKNKVADTVKELSKSNQTASSGYVTEYKNETAKFKNPDGTTFTAKIDSVLTKVYQVNGASTKDVKTTAIIKGAYIIVTGPVIGDVINANSVYLDEHFEIVAGKLAEVNTDDAILKIIGIDKETYNVDYVTATRFFLVNSKTFETERTTIAKLKEGDTIQVVYSYDPDAKDPRSFSATKVLVVPQEYFAK